MRVAYRLAVRYVRGVLRLADSTSGRLRCVSILLCCLVAFTIAGCPPTVSPPPSVPPPGSVTSPDSPDEQRRLYATADALRTRGQFAQAQQAFRDFVQRFPTSPWTDDALLALGQVSTALGEHTAAQAAYETLLQTFPTSEHLQQAQIEVGMSYYHTKQYDRSQVVLRQLLAGPGSPERQALAHYYLGSIAREQQHYDQALAEFMQGLAGPDAELARQVRQEIARIVHDDLPLPTLESLARQYATAYPGDLLLMRLAQRYRDAGNEVDEIAVLQRFTTAFPDHADAPAAMARLDELQEILTTDRTRIGVLLPFSGEADRYGQSALRGIELALAVWQEHYPNTDLSLVVRDSHSVSASASDMLRALVNEARVIGVIGPLLSHEATALAPLAEQLKVPMMSPYAPDGQFPAASTYAFRNSLTDVQQARFLAQYALSTLHLRRFAVLYPDEPYGVTLKDAFIEQVIQRQGKVVAAVSYPPDATDFGQSIRRIGGIDDESLRDLRAGAESTAPGASRTSYDALFIPGYYDKVGLIAPALAFYNLTGIQLLGTDGWNEPALIEIGERFVEGALFVDGFFAASPSPIVREFVERFEARYQEQPDILAAQAYDTFRMIAQVLQQDGAKTRTQLRNGLLRVQNFVGVSGSTTMQPNGDADKTPYLLTIRNGQIVQVAYPQF